jgi:dihydroorotate dehydrogenase (NAD+) catalytic subunit
MAVLAVSLPPLELRNPILSASGTFGHGLEMQHLVPPELLGGLVSKTVTLRPRAGNALPRICETQAGFLNSIGLENRGIEAYLEEVVPVVSRADTAIFTNIGGESPDEFAELARMLDGVAGIDALEVNLSCPNVQGGRIPFGTDPHAASEVIGGVRAATTKPIYAKLSPNVARIEDMAVAVAEAGADGITAVNTVLAMSVDWRTRTAGLATIQGGYSGVAIKPIALRCAWECARAVSIPVIGCGGIGRAEDVLEFLVVGCSAVQVGTASFSDPGRLAGLADELERLLASAGVDDVRELVGSLRTWDGAAQGAARSPAAPRDPVMRVPS